MLREISIDELSRLENVTYIDVRSEKEFYEGTIPGAINLPLFNNEERARIGTIYTKESVKKAMAVGLEIASGKLPDLYKKIDEIAGAGSVMLFCWRGGMRSKSLAAVLDLMGLSVLRLRGGYKAYRRTIVDFFEEKFATHVVVIRGNTGTGKTELLKRIKSDGYPVIDLEGLSNNRGSVFGQIGLGAQPSQKQFESLLFQEIQSYQNFSYLIMECESKRIGRVTIPSSVYDAMQQGTQILLYDSVDNRASRLVREYAVKPEMIEELQSALERLKQRISKKSLEQLQSFLNEKKFQEFAKCLILEYYDHLYGYPNEDTENKYICISNEMTNDCFEELKKFLDNRFF